METILVATDFSTPATNAVSYATELARFFKTRLILTNACPMIVSGDPMVTVDMGPLLDSSRDALNQLRDRLSQEHPGLAVECYSGIGTPYDVIKTAADNYSANLLVMGMTGEAGSFKERLIGSSAITVARGMHTPLFIVPEGARYQKIRNISLACDMDHAEDSNLVYSAKYFARLFDAVLEIVTVDKEGGSEMSLQQAAGYSFVEKNLHTLKHKYVYLKEHDTSTALEYYFKFHDTDLVMVNPQKHSFFQKLFSGSITRHLAFHSKQPLLVIH